MNTDTVNVNAMVSQMTLQIKSMKSLIKRTSDPYEQAKLQHELAIQESILEQLKSGNFGNPYAQLGIR